MASNIHSSNNATVNRFPGNGNVKSLFFSYICEEDVLHVFHFQSNKTSTDGNNSSTVLIKKCIESIIKPFTYICNKFYESGIFPDSMKIVLVFPVFKAGDKSQFDNYRPIALLPPFYRILQKIFEKRLESFLERKNIINEYNI